MGFKSCRIMQSLSTKKALYIMRNSIYPLKEGFRYLLSYLENFENSLAVYMNQFMLERSVCK